MIALAILTAGWTHAQETRWFLLPEPAYMRPPFEISIEGTTQTVLTPALIKGDQATILTRETFDRLGLNLESIQRVSRASASAALAELEPQYVRDQKGVAVFAILQSSRPIAAAAVLAPDFVEKFRDTLGPDLLVAIPNRYRVYVYPALASRFERTADHVLADYKVSAYPVSKEVFRVTSGGIQAIGTFEDR